NVDGAESFAQLVQQAKRTTLAAYAQQHVPFERVVEAVAPQRDLSRNPLFQVMFALQNIPEVPLSEFGGLQVKGEAYAWDYAKCDLTVEVDPTGGNFLLRVEYSCDLFEEATIRRLIGHFELLLTQLAANPDRRLDAASLLAPAEEELLTVAFNQTAADYPHEASLPLLFEQQVARTPERPALRFAADAALSYREVNEQANRVAHYLQSSGIAPGQRVGVLAHRSPALLTALLGILKCGAIYVPLNTDYPTSRLHYIAEDADLVAVVFTDAALLAHLPDYAGPRLALADAAAFPDTNLPVAIAPEAGAYVMYTSGTTGQAKGILVTHRNVAKLAFDPGPIRIQADDVVLQWSNFAFDGSTYDIYGSLLQGACLQLIPEGAAADAGQLIQLIREQGVTVAFLTTALFNVLVDTELDSLCGLRRLLFGGELVSVPHVQRALAALGPDVLVHVYGPTETTTYATSYAVGEVAGQTVPIGYPLANTRAYVLDEQQRPVPVGCHGELYIGGDGVATGYLNKAELTAERFVEVPAYGRLYRTGDQVYWRPDGALCYVGRLDGQVKIRGYRVELGEIETLLQAAPGVAQAVVLARRDAANTLNLVAYVVPETGFTVAAAAQQLAQRLPDYMVPTAWVSLDALPLTPNGKVDKQALPAPPEAEVAAVYLAPRTAREVALAAIWQTLLNRERVGVTDNFFAVGGHSLLAMRLVAAIRHQLSQELTIRQIFTHPTIAQQAGLMTDEAAVPAIAPLTPQARPARIPLSFAQERLWFIDQLEGGANYHVPVLLRLRGDLNQEALHAGLRQLVARHETLRTIILSDEQEARQALLPAAGWALEDPASSPADMTEVRAWLARPFDLAADYPIRARLWGGTDGQEHLLALVVHHIACDGWSLGVLVRELALAYEAALTGSVPAWPALPVQYADYALWQRRCLTDEALAPGLAYWREQLAGLTPLPLPTDFERPVLPSQQGGSLFRPLPQSLLTAVERVAQREGATLFMGLLAGFQALLARYAGQADICVGTPVAGRTQAAEEHLVGLLVNTLALRGNVDGAESFAQLVQQAKRTTLAAYAQQHVPFERVVEAVAPQRD
ncbi:MAG: amino acid adenylation domain-containing protein, partial [Bacteroidota bacterium]|nr:amino acid adenylation domain-containing protein [Bacteroidota bacterium]